MEILVSTYIAVYSVINHSFCRKGAAVASGAETDDWRIVTLVTQSCTIGHDEEVFQPHKEKKAALWDPWQRECPFWRIRAKRQGSWKSSQSCCRWWCGKVEGTCWKTWYQSTGQREQVSEDKSLHGLVTPFWFFCEETPIANTLLMSLKHLKM